MKPKPTAKPHEIAIYNAAHSGMYGHMMPVEFSVPAFLKALKEAGYYVTPIEKEKQ